MNCERVWNGNYANKSDMETGQSSKEESRQMAGQARYVQMCERVCVCASGV